MEYFGNMHFLTGLPPFFFKGNWSYSTDSRTPGTHIDFTSLPSLPYVQARTGDPPSAIAQGLSALSGQ